MHSYTHSFRRPMQSALTLDSLRQIVPSAFAVEATSGVIEAMMREGFQPFKATQGGSRIEGKAEYTKHMIRFRHPDMGLQNVGDSKASIEGNDLVIRIPLNLPPPTLRVR